MCNCDATSPQQMKCINYYLTKIGLCAILMLELHFTAQTFGDSLFMHFWVHLAILLTTA